ncbi:hypothetical protein FLONG3_2863 [Fusarium longipes]|uniref:Cyclin N-terminal domain-containing protein n=1 Tax=Fusarium longipes TaxID=694270 RepID=A0A395T361_9HYPO|nr:hypothetical protein FLONG3_2863 [Fusarium longipes]
MDAAGALRHITWILQTLDPYFLPEPQPTIDAMLYEIIRYLLFDQVIVLAVIIYLQRLLFKIQLDPETMSNHRKSLVVVAMFRIVNKFVCDFPHQRTDNFVILGGIFDFLQADLNACETKILELMNWDLKIENEELTHLENVFQQRPPDAELPTDFHEQCLRILSRSREPTTFRLVRGSWLRNGNSEANGDSEADRRSETIGCSEYNGNSEANGTEDDEILKLMDC